MKTRSIWEESEVDEPADTDQMYIGPRTGDRTNANPYLDVQGDASWQEACQEAEGTGDGETIGEILRNGDKPSRPKAKAKKKGG